MLRVNELSQLVAIDTLWLLTSSPTWLISTLLFDIFPRFIYKVIHSINLMVKKKKTPEFGSMVNFFVLEKPELHFIKDKTLSLHFGEYFVNFTRFLERYIRKRPIADKVDRITSFRQVFSRS